MNSSGSAKTRKIYFLVNNNYQYIEAARLARELRNDGHLVGLIAIPHTLTVSFDSALFNPIISIPTPARLPWPRAWLRYLRSRTQMRAVLPVTTEDKLILFTEFELLNHMVAVVFKERGASVFLIEDGGVGSYIPFTLKKSAPFGLKDQIRGVSIRAIPGLRRTHFAKFDGIVFPMLEDSYVDSVFLYRPVTINRKISVSVIARPLMHGLERYAGRVVFLNQPLYSEHIQSNADYINGLEKILTALCVGYSEVIFKFHPREPLAARGRIINQILSSFPKLRILEDNQPLEEILADLRPEAVASYNSTPLLNLAGSGVQPLFLYHLLPDLRKRPSFDTLQTLLELWEYHFPTDWSEVASGYHAGTKFHNVASGIPLAAALKLSSSASKAAQPSNSDAGDVIGHS